MNYIFIYIKVIYFIYILIDIQIYLYSKIVLRVMINTMAWLILCIWFCYICAVIIIKDKELRKKVERLFTQCQPAETLTGCKVNSQGLFFLTLNHRKVRKIRKVRLLMLIYNVKEKHMSKWLNVDLLSLF